WILQKASQWQSKHSQQIGCGVC
ncbi:hypothetical protein AVDCRST_MAG92-2599, partial [uncultured Coleofasciculus sp.]